MMDYKNTIARILHLLMIITQITAVHYEVSRKKIFKFLFFKSVVFIKDHCHYKNVRLTMISDCLLPKNFRRFHSNGVGY